MDNLEHTIQEYYEIQEFICKLHQIFITKIKNDIEGLDELTNVDRIYLMGILGKLKLINRILIDINIFIRMSWIRYFSG